MLDVKRLEDLAGKVDNEGREVQKDNGGNGLLDGEVGLGLEGSDLLLGLLGGRESTEHLVC